MKVKVVLLILFSALCFTGLNAQKNNKKVTITGTVLDVNKNPIANAIILIDDQKTNSLTDASGKYSVKVKPTAARISIFTFGSGTFEDSIKGRTVIDFNFSVASIKAGSKENTVQEGEQGVNSGYGVVKKKNLTTDINKIDGTNKKYASYHDITEMIEREVSGVRVVNGTVVIQDSRDFAGTVPALFVVDGVPVDGIPDIPPSSVKSIEVLKGTSASIYGNRGYGGAILIKTKVQND